MWSRPPAETPRQTIRRAGVVAPRRRHLGRHRPPGREPGGSGCGAQSSLPWPPPSSPLSGVSAGVPGGSRPARPSPAARVRLGRRPRRARGGGDAVARLGGLAGLRGLLGSAVSRGSAVSVASAVSRASAVSPGEPVGGRRARGRRGLLVAAGRSDRRWPTSPPAPRPAMPVRGSRSRRRPPPRRGRRRRPPRRRRGRCADGNDPWCRGSSGRRSGPVDSGLRAAGRSDRPATPPETATPPKVSGPGRLVAAPGPRRGRPRRRRARAPPRPPRRRPRHPTTTIASRSRSRCARAAASTSSAVTASIAGRYRSSSSSGSSWVDEPADGGDDRARRLEAEREDADEVVARGAQLGLGGRRLAHPAQLGEEVGERRRGRVGVDGGPGGERARRAAGSRTRRRRRTCSPSPRAASCSAGC